MNPILRSRWFAASLHGALWVLLLAILGEVGGSSLKYVEATGTAAPSSSSVPVSKLLSLFFLGDWPKLLAGTNSVNPFFTRYFIPPTVPQPPPPTTRRIELTYQGFFQAGGGPRHVFLKTGDSLFVGPVGARAVANWFVAEVNAQSLVLTNPAAQTNVLPFNARKEIEVPVQ